MVFVKLELNDLAKRISFPIHCSENGLKLGIRDQAKPVFIWLETYKVPT